MATAFIIIGSVAAAVVIYLFGANNPPRSVRDKIIKKAQGW